MEIYDPAHLGTLLLEFACSYHGGVGRYSANFTQTSSVSVNRSFYSALPAIYLYLIYLALSRDAWACMPCGAPPLTMNVSFNDRRLGKYFHYTNAAGLLGMFSSQTVWATSALHLNDSQEYRLGITRFRKAVDIVWLHADATEKKRLSKFREALDAFGSVVQLYVSSFSEERDLLSQWLAYAAGSNGYCIGFRRAHFRQAFQQGFRLVKCIYDNAEHSSIALSVVGRIAAAQSELDLESKEMVEALAAIASIKHSGFRQEKEWRLIRTAAHIYDASNELAFRSGRNGIVPYLAAPLIQQRGTFRPDTITVGPNDDVEAARSALECLLASRAMRGLFIESRPSVLFSETPHRI